MHKHLARLDQVYLDTAVIYITVCTRDRRQVLANQQMHDICCEVWRNAESFYGWLVGRYVVMPDHVHFFCTPHRQTHKLQTFVGKWKEWTAKYGHRRHGLSMPLWQPEFFDHLLRTSESYEEKWLYVRDNPLRAGLVGSADEWPYQGELHALRY
jgi:putative transposase